MHDPINNAVPRTVRIMKGAGSCFVRIILFLIRWGEVLDVGTGAFDVGCCVTGV